MIKLKDMGEFKSVPQIVSDIISGNLPALDEYLKLGWEIRWSYKFK